MSEHQTRATTTTPAVQVYTLGGFRVLVKERPVEDKAWRRRTARQLFKALLSRPGRRMTRDEVVELFWPDSDPEAASSNIRSTLYAMRHALESANAGSFSPVVGGDHDSVWLRSDDDLWTDADAFEQKVAAAWRSTNPLPLLEEASSLYVGEFLPDDVFEDWAVDRRESLKRTWTELQFGLARALETHVDFNAAMQPLERLLRSDPCDERAAQELIKLLARNGRRSEALRVYQRLVRQLREELEVEPSPESVALYRQISAGESAAALSRPASGFRCSYPFPAPSQLIAREAELAVLSHVLGAARSTGKAAFVAAPAGTGKSALVGQIVREAQAQGVLCLAGGCYEDRGTVPLGPFHDALVDFLLAEPPEQLRADLGASAEDLARVIPELRYHLQLAAPEHHEVESLDRARVFGVIHGYLRQLAEKSPVLVCLEDLHSADEATVQLLHYLARQTRRVPLVLIATYRSDEAPADQPLAQTVATMTRERLVQRVILEPLNREETEGLVSSLLEGTPSPSLGESLFATTGGNPLFVEQLVLALNESGQIERKGGVLYGVADLQRTPPIVGEVIAQRLQRLDYNCREVLAMASVLGQSFAHPVLLAALEPLDESKLLANLDRAIGVQILREVTGGYAFRHGLVREAVYWSLTSPRRMALHARAGEQLERYRGERADDYAAELAHHYGLAGESAGVRAKAVRYSLRAGQRAAQLSSYPEALAHFIRAWEIIQSSPELTNSNVQLDALNGRAWAELKLARYADSIQSYRQTLVLATDPLQRGRAHKGIAFCLSHAGAFNDVIQECEAGLAELASLTDPEATNVRVELHQLIGVALVMQGRFHEVVELGRRMEVEASHAGPPQRLYAHFVQAWGFRGLGVVQSALEQYELAVTEGQYCDKQDLAIAYEGLGIQNYLGGRFAIAHQFLGRSLVLYQQSANELRAVNALHALCRLLIAEGDHARAKEQVVRAIDVEAEGEGRWMADARHILGTLQLFSGEWTEARANFERAHRIWGRVGQRSGIVEALVGSGSVDQCLGNWNDAVKQYRRALDVAETMDPSPQRVLAQRSLGRLHLLAGDAVEAAAELESALELARTMPETLEYVPAVLAVAELRFSQKRTTDALELGNHALEHANAVDQLIDANILLARIHLAMGNIGSASKHVSDALPLAQRLGCPRHLSSAFLVSAETAWAQDSGRASAEFEIALRFANNAGAPYERSLVLRSFADFARGIGAGTDRATSMSREAAAIAQGLQLWPEKSQPPPGLAPV